MKKKVVSVTLIAAILVVAYFFVSEEKEEKQLNTSSENIANQGDAQLNGEVKLEDAISKQDDLNSEDKIVAMIGDKPIYESEVREKIQTYMELNSMPNGESINYDKLDKGVKEEIVKSIVIGDLIISEAEKAKIYEVEEYKTAIQFAKNQLMQRLFIETTIKNNLTDEKLKARYAKVVKDRSNVMEYKVSHILVKTEEEAKLVKKKLDEGKNFVELAKEYSLDSNKEEGGSLPYFSRGQMVPDFENAVEKLKINQISNPVKTEFGYHLIKLEAKRAAKVASFEELKTKLSEEISSEFIQEYIEQLKLQNKVSFVEIQG